MNTTKVIIAFITLCSLLLHTSTFVLMAQQLYPGDVTNNGIVNNVDVLFWSYARGAEGQARTNASSAWQAEDLPEVLWEGSFPGLAGNNYAYADCNGDGKVDDDDLYVIIDNYYEIQPSGVQPDQFSQSDIQSAHSLLLSAQEPDTEGGATELINLNLTGYTGTVPTFYGTAFTLAYDPDFIAGEANQSEIDFTYDTGNDENEWYAGSEKDEAAYFIWSNDEAGFAEVVLYKKDPLAAQADFGEVGRFSIVVEEVIFGLEVDPTIDLIVPYTVDKDFRSAGESDGEGTKFIITNDVSTFTDEPLSQQALQFFPNPVGEEGLLRIKLDGEEASVIERIEILDLSGRTILQQPFNHSECVLSLESVKAGGYVIKVVTDGGVGAYQLIRK